MTEMKSIVIACLFLCHLAVLHAEESVAPAVVGPTLKTEVRVMTYDSMIAKAGLGSAVELIYSSEYPKCRVKWIASGNGGQILTKLELSKERGVQPDADIAIGVDYFSWSRSKVFAEAPSVAAKVEVRTAKLIAPLQVKSLKKAYSEGLVPFDYGILALIANQKLLKELKLEKPASLASLTDAKFKKQWLLEDPRTSTPGFGFLALTSSVVEKKKFSQFWKNLSRSWLALPPGWEAAYGIFMKGEAPLVWSYTTSEAYHRAKEKLKPGDEGNYVSLLFEEGNPIQLEGAFTIKRLKRSDAERECIEGFYEVLLSQELQSKVAKANWMLPVRSGVELPEEFRKLPTPAKESQWIWGLSDAKDSKNSHEKLLDQWAKAIE